MLCKAVCDVIIQKSMDMKLWSVNEVFVQLCC